MAEINPPDPPPPLDLAPILARAAQLAEARAKMEATDRDQPPTDHLGRISVADHVAYRDVCVKAYAEFEELAYEIDLSPDVRALAAECERLKAENERLREIEATARNFIRCTTDPRLSPYVRENGRHGKSPWAELIDAVDAARGSRGGPPP